MVPCLKMVPRTPRACQPLHGSLHGSHRSFLGRRSCHFVPPSSCKSLRRCVRLAVTSPRRTGRWLDSSSFPETETETETETGFFSPSPAEFDDVTGVAASSETETEILKRASTFATDEKHNENVLETESSSSSSSSKMCLPRHVAVIMDGNARWARRRRVPTLEGHRRGRDALRRLVERCAEEREIHALTAFAFSDDNFRKRPVHEVDALFRLMEASLREERPRMLRNGVQIAFAGDIDALPASLAMLCREVEAEAEAHAAASSTPSRLLLTVAMNYGARQDIVDAARRLVDMAQRGELAADDVDESLFRSALGTSKATRHAGDPDLLVRTSGEQRMSNFLLFESAYTELFFSDVEWPAFDDVCFDKALHAFSTRTRRFGGRNDDKHETRE